MPQEISGMVFKIELVGVEKPIWRRFFVPRNISFKKFQEVISVAMGWKGWKKHSRLDGQSNCFAFSFGQVSIFTLQSHPEYVFSRFRATTICSV